MTSRRAGFTLVELIVVITVLAILGTIGFISFQGYTADARDAKRTQDLGSIATVIANARAKSALPLSTYYTPVAGNANSIAVTSASIGGYKSPASNLTLATNYDAGTVNYTALQIASRDFSDPTTSAPYIMGWTTLDNASYELSATLENQGVPKASVKGSYIPRAQAVLPSAGTALLNGAAVALPIASASAGMTFTVGGLTNTDGSNLRVGDLMGLNSTTPAALGTPTNAFTVARISSDMKTITMNVNTTQTATVAIPTTTAATQWVVPAEQAGLIKGVTTTTCLVNTPVTDSSTSCMPY